MGKIKIKKVQKSQAWLQLFETGRETRENFRSIDGGTQNLRAQSLCTQSLHTPQTPPVKRTIEQKYNTILKEKEHENDH